MSKHELNIFTRYIKCMYIVLDKYTKALISYEV